VAESFGDSLCKVVCLTIGMGVGGERYRLYRLLRMTGLVNESHEFGTISNE